jgi:hypothetical protein
MVFCGFNAKALSVNGSQMHRQADHQGIIAIDGFWLRLPPLHMSKPILWRP